MRNHFSRRLGAAADAQVGGSGSGERGGSGNSGGPGGSGGTAGNLL